MRDIINLLEEKSKDSKLEILKLSYSDNSLSPVISGSSLKLHKKLWTAYCDKFNANQGDKQFNYSGYWLHNLFFTQFRPARTNNTPNGPIGSLIKSKYKSFDAFKEAVEEQAMKLHGSGWVYLARDGTIKTIQNHQVRNDILILIDMWEHAFQNDYGSNKEKYLDNIWRIIDWNAINTRWGQGYK